MRCMAHIINLVVQYGLKEANLSVSRVRDAIKFVRISPQRLKTFKKCVKYKNIDSKSLLCTDLPTRWNSTYLMLSSAEKFQPAFERFGKINPLFVHDLSSCDGEPTTDDWDVV
ncbi:hypothetical protein M5689_000621 [Euphorbia peplus]|nr:hypothetical protein M5689_000621 [Euphorbia peplus]